MSPQVDGIVGAFETPTLDLGPLVEGWRATAAGAGARSGAAARLSPPTRLLGTISRAATGPYLAIRGTSRQMRPREGLAGSNIDGS